MSDLEQSVSTSVEKKKTFLVEVAKLKK